MPAADDIYLYGPGIFGVQRYWPGLGITETRFYNPETLVLVERLVVYDD